LFASEKLHCKKSKEVDEVDGADCTNLAKAKQGGVPVAGRQDTRVDFNKVKATVLCPECYFDDKWRSRLASY